MPVTQFKPYTYEVTRTVEQRYPYGIQIPEGFEETGEFRPPKKDEYWLSFGRIPSAYSASNDYDISDPVIILRKQKEYTDTEILQYVLNWLWSAVGANAISSARPSTDKPNGPWNIYRRLISSDYESKEDIKKGIIKEMRLKGV